MIRALAMLLLLAAPAPGQRPRPRQPEAPLPEVLTLDATVTGEDGKPLTGLSATDFELTHGGERREIEQVTWQSGPRNIIVIVDDLGLSAERVRLYNERLQAFIGKLRPGDRAAIVRTSSAAGWQQQLVTNRAAMREQIEQIQPVGQGIGDAMAANAIAQAIRWTLDTAPPDGSRKAVAILAEPSHLAALRDNSNLLPTAHRFGVVFYLIGANVPPAGDSFSQDTGGLTVPDLESLLNAEQGHYEIAFRPSREGMQNQPASLQLRGKSGRLRWRSGFLPSSPERAFDRPGTTTGGDLRVYLTSIFMGYDKNNAIVDLLIRVDGHDISTLRDLKGVRRGSADFQIIPYSLGGRAPGSFARTIQLDLDDAKYEQLLRGGTQITARLGFQGAGGYQLRAVVSDGLSGRVGSAMEFIDIPPPRVLSVSGLILTTKETQGDGVAAMPIYRPGSAISFVYGVFNAATGSKIESHLSVRSRIVAGGKVVFEGSPTELNFPPTDNSLRQVKATVNLDDHVSPGHYAIEVEVTDLLAKEGAPRVATRYRTFEVRE